MPDEVTWVGHATLAVEWAGVRVLSDPLLTRRVAHLRRRSIPPDPRVAQCDLVVLSHAHRDHLHRRSLRRVAAASPQARVVAPPGTRRLLADLGFAQIHELAPGQRLTVDGALVTVVPAVHPGGRGPRDDPRMPAVGHLLEAGGRRVYLAGDTDLYDGLADLPPIDLAALPIGGWWRTLGEGHLDPARAALAVQRIDPRWVLPVHWGTFAPETGVAQPTWLDRPGAEFARALAGLGLSDRLLALAPGQTGPW